MVMRPVSSTGCFSEAIAEGEILVSDVTSSSAYIQWRAVEGVIFYMIVTEPSDAIGPLGGIFEEEVGLTILLPGTVFNVTVQNGITSSNLASTQIRSAPGSPVNVTLDQIGSTEATISWTPPTTPRDAYEVYVINNSTNERLLAATIRPEEVNECTVNGLSRAWVYKFEVGTLLDASNSFALQRSDMNSNPSVLGRTEAIAEGEILVSDVTSSSAYIEWRAVEGVIFYTIVTEPSDAIGPLGGIFEEEVGLTILLPGTVFNVTVQNGQSSSNLASTQIRSAPGSPVNVTLDQIGSTEATISWTPPTTPRDAYEVYVINNSTNERLLAATIRPEEDNECTVNSLSRAWVYRFEVGTLLDASNSFALQRSDMNSNPSVLGRTGPEAPLGVFVSSITDVSVSLTLTPPSSPHDGYELYKLNPTDNHRTLVSNLTRENGMIYETDIVGLVPATLYYVEVGTFLNAEGSFPLQMSEEYAAVTFQTVPRVYDTLRISSGSCLLDLRSVRQVYDTLRLSSGSCLLDLRSIP
nr:phosphatidylinositol phosphatase PTPRQ-like [Lytechinus pictus]